MEARVIRLFAGLMLAALAACGASDNDPGVGGVTAGEAQALNDAAEMLDQRYNAATAAVLPPANAADNAQASKPD